jgi:hypothetical protein
VQLPSLAEIGPPRSPLQWQTGLPGFQGLSSDRLTDLALQPVPQQAALADR